MRRWSAPNGSAYSTIGRVTWSPDPDRRRWRRRGPTSTRARSPCVRWRDERGAERSKTFDKLGDARAYEGKLRTLKRTGFDAVLVMGAPWSVYGDEVTPWIDALHAEMAAHDQSDYTGLGEITARLTAVQDEIEELEMRWLELSEDLV